MANVDALVATPDGQYRRPIAGELAAAVFLSKPGQSMEPDGSDLIPQAVAAVAGMKPPATAESASWAPPSSPSWSCGSALYPIIGAGASFSVADGTPATCPDGSVADRCVVAFISGDGLEVFPKGFSFTLMAPVQWNIQQFDFMAAQSVAVLFPSNVSQIVKDVLSTRGMKEAFRTRAPSPLGTTPPFAQSIYAISVPPTPAFHRGDNIDEIPVLDMEEVESRWNQLHSVLDEVPWFKIGSYDLIFDCSGNVPIGTLRDGRKVVWDEPRLYAPSLSDYFPKSKAEIHASLATAIGASLESIFGCVASSLKVKAERAEKQGKMIGTIEVIVGGTLMIFGAIPPNFTMLGHGAGLVFPQYANWIGIVSKAMDTAIGFALAGLGTAVTSLVEQVNSGMVKDLMGQLSKLIDSGVGDSAKKLMEAALSIQSIEGISAPFLLWTIMAPKLGPVLAMGSSLLGIDVDLKKDVIDPLIAKAEASGMSVPDYLRSMAAENAAGAERAKQVAKGEASLEESDLGTGEGLGTFGTAALVGGGLAAVYFSGLL